MTHADHLRSMAKDHLIAGNERTADALLAGADALDALAADTLEYGVADAAGDIMWFPVDDTMPAEDAYLAAAEYANSDQFFRLVCRRVSQPWDSEGTTPTEQHQAEMDEQWRLLRDHNAEAWHVLNEVMHAKAKGRKTIRIDDLLGVTDE